MKKQQEQKQRPRQGNRSNYGKFIEQIIKPFGISEDGVSNLKAALPVPAFVGLKVYNHGYFLRLEEVLVDTYSGLFFITEEAGFRHLMTAYLERHPPVGSSIQSVGSRMADFLHDPELEFDFDFGAPLDLLADIAAVEWARAEAFIAVDDSWPVLKVDELRQFTPYQWETTAFHLASSLQLVHCRYDVFPVLSAIERGEVPDPPGKAVQDYLIYRREHSVLEEAVSEEDSRILQAMVHGANLLSLCDISGRQMPGHYSSETLALIAGKIVTWVQRGFLTQTAVSEIHVSPEPAPL